MTADSSYQQLKSKKTLADILDIAIEFERSARDFYSELSPRVSKKIRFLVDELAEEEQRHYDLFSNLRQRDDLEKVIQQLIEIPVSDKRFSDCIHLPELGDHPDDQTVLQYAMGREHTAMEQYRSLTETAPPGPIKDLFTLLADEETQHKNELEKLYYEIVHSGGV